MNTSLLGVAQGIATVKASAPQVPWFVLGWRLQKGVREGLAHDVGHPSSRCPKSKHRPDFRRACWVAERSRRGDRICRSWYFKNYTNLSVIVMRVTETGDKVVYRLGRDKGRSRTPTSYGGATRGRRGEQSLRKNTAWRKAMDFYAFSCSSFRESA